jgi:hypothetical protein
MLFHLSPHLSSPLTPRSTAGTGTHLTVLHKLIRNALAHYPSPAVGQPVAAGPLANPFMLAPVAILGAAFLPLYVPPWFLSGVF